MERITIILFCFTLYLFVVYGAPILPPEKPLTPQEETLDVIVDTLGARVDIMEKTLQNLEAMVLAHGDAIEEQSLKIQEMYTETSKGPIDFTTVVTTNSAVVPTDNFSPNKYTGEKINMNGTNTGLINENDLKPSTDNNKEQLIEPGNENVTEGEIGSESKQQDLGPDALKEETEIKPETNTELVSEQEQFQEQEDNARQEQDPMQENEEELVTGTETEQGTGREEQELDPESEQELNPEEQELGSEGEQELNPEGEQKLVPEAEQEFAFESEQEAGSEVGKDMDMEMEQATGNEASQESEQTSEHEAEQEATEENPPFEPVEFIDDTYEGHNQGILDHIFGMPTNMLLEPATFDDEHQMEPLDSFPFRKNFRKQWRKRARKNNRKMWRKKKQQRRRKSQGARRKWRRMQRNGQNELF